MRGPAGVAVDGVDASPLITELANCCVSDVVQW